MCEMHIKASGHVAEGSNKALHEARSFCQLKNGAKNGEATPE